MNDLLKIFQDIFAVPLHENVLLKLGIAALFGLIIGLDRELKKKPLGLKTCLVLSVSSCLLTIVSIQAVYDFEMNENIRVDPLRLAAQIVSGVGFIGAGVILKRSNEVIVGLTTAAMIWGASGIGIAIGAGYYIEATGALLIILLGVDLFPDLMKRIGPKTLRLREMDVILHVLEDEIEEIQDILNEFELQKFIVRNLMIKNLDSGMLQLQMRIETNEKQTVAEIFQVIHGISGVKNVDLRSY